MSTAAAFEVFFADSDALDSIENRRLTGYDAEEVDPSDLAAEKNGADENGSLSKTLMGRFEYFLGRDHYRRMQISRAFKSFYHLRSRVIHQGRRCLGPNNRRDVDKVRKYLSVAIEQEAIAIDPAEHESSAQSRK